MRRRMEDAGFTEYSTPILTASSPEGARDFLVPSRIHAGKFYALPQAPQQYKQLLMVAGFDRYFQIAPCFRDEDPRADRLPGEFYQLDLEMSFVTQEDVWNTMEPVIAQIFEAFADGKHVTPAGSFPRIPHAEAMLKYGSDKPDLRNPIIIQDVTDHFVGSGFGIFASLAESGSVIRAIPAPGAGAGSRKFFDDMNVWARGEGYSGLGYINIKDGVPGGPIAKNHGEEATAKLIAALGLGPNDGVFFAAGKESQAAKLAGLARIRVGEQLNLIDKDRFELCWIVDFPFYEYDEDEKKIDYAHNPFSMPQGGLDALNTQDPLTLKAYQYDMVCNGYEIASGSIRNQSPEAMVKAFELVGLSQADVEERFGGLYRAFQYGAPPHGGMAAGVDRIVMLLCGDEPARRGPADGRAEPRRVQAAARIACPRGGAAGEGIDSFARYCSTFEKRERTHGLSVLRCSAAAWSCFDKQRRSCGRQTELERAACSLSPRGRSASPARPLINLDAIWSLSEGDGPASPVDVVYHEEQRHVGARPLRSRHAHP